MLGQLEAFMACPSPAPWRRGHPEKERDNRQMDVRDEEKESPCIKNAVVLCRATEGATGACLWCAENMLGHRKRLAG